MLKVNETKPKQNKAKHLFIATEQKWLKKVLRGKIIQMVVQAWKYRS